MTTVARLVWHIVAQQPLAKHNRVIRATMRQCEDREATLPKTVQ